MFKRFLSDTAHYTEYSVPFLAHRAVFNDSMQLFADLSFLGFGCCFQNAWAQGQWADSTIFQQSVNPNITLLELFAIAVAVFLWAPQLQGKFIVLHSDSAATVGWLTHKRTPIPAAMQIIHQLTLTCLHFQIVVKAIHLTRTKNWVCDQISCLRVNQMLQENPHMERHPTLLPPTLWLPVWSGSDMTNREKPQKGTHHTREPPRKHHKWKKWPKKPCLPWGSTTLTVSSWIICHRNSKAWLITISRVTMQISS